MMSFTVGSADSKSPAVSSGIKAKLQELSAQIPEETLPNERSVTCDCGTEWKIQAQKAYQVEDPMWRQVGMNSTVGFLLE